MQAILSIVLMAAVLTCAACPIAAALTRLRQDNPVEGIWAYVVAVLLLVTLMLNANLWFPMQAVVWGVATLAVSRLFVRRQRAPSMTLASTAVPCIASVALVCLGLSVLFGLSRWWLLEGPNHDSLFYFEGAAWAWQHGLRTQPAAIAGAWQLGTCAQGAVFIGTDCPLFRNGTYSLLAFANTFNRPATANAVQASAAFATVFTALGALVLTRTTLSHRAWSWTTVAAILGAVLVAFAPGAISALTNANTGTFFGAAAVAMTLALAIAPCESAGLRAVALGLCTAIAGHTYGEAVVPAGLLAAAGVINDAFRMRRPAHAVIGGMLALGTCVLALNIVLLDLTHSFLVVSGVAKGGGWQSWYLQQSGWAWAAAPFAGIILGLDPPVTRSLVVVGLVLAVLVAPTGLRMASTRIATFAVIALVGLLAGYVELRHYAYGEHKVVQLVGPLAVMLSFAVALHLAALGSSRRRQFLAGAIVLLLAAGSIMSATRARSLLNDSRIVHGLSPDVVAALNPVQVGDIVLLDDTGAIGVERFQKDHYLGFLLTMRQASVLMPNIADEPLRGGYLRSVRGDTLRIGVPDWILRLRSEGGARSPFVYPAGTVLEGDEYDLVQAAKVPAVLAAGDGWYGCEAAHCWTRSPFEIESYVGPACGAQGAIIIANVSYFNPPSSAHVVVTQAGAADNVVALDGQLTAIVPPGWSRMAVSSSWPLMSPYHSGMSEDSRPLFAMVHSVSAICASPTLRALEPVDSR